MTNAMYGKSNGKWDQVYPEPDRGVAPALTAAPDVTEITYTWTAATGITPVSYEMDFNGVITDVGNVLSVTKSGLTTGQTYTARVRARAAAYSGEWSNLLSTVAAVPYNSATGGTTADVSNYNGTGQTWRVHTFTADGTFVVASGGKPFRRLLVGSGGATGNYPAGGGGEVLADDAAAIAAGSYAVDVGVGASVPTIAFGLTARAGAAGGYLDTGNNNPGGASGNGNPGGSNHQESGNFGGGGGGGAGGAGNSGNDNGVYRSGGNGGPGIASDITGASLMYGVGGNGSGVAGDGRTPAGAYGTGGGRNNTTLQSGVAIIAYQIA